MNIDVSAELDGFFSDTGISVAVGDVSPVASRLLEATKLAQRDAMNAAHPGAQLRDLGRAVQRRARRHGFRVIKNLHGHGIGRGLHEAPSVPSIDDGQRMVLREGLVLAIEPFLSVSADHVIDDADGWTLRTADGSLAAQFRALHSRDGTGPHGSDRVGGFPYHPLTIASASVDPLRTADVRFSDTERDPLFGILSCGFTA